MKIWSDSFLEGQPIPGEFALCVPDEASHVAMAPNRNPHLAWDGVPAGTRSFALLCIDPDAPTVADDVNQEGREVPATLPRAEFSHWVLVDLAPDLRALAAGSHSSEVTAGGKSGPAGPGGARHGINNYTDWFAGDADMAGDYYGYDGPCPPWNDAIVHRYEFRLYALDVSQLAVDGRFGFAEVRSAMEGHILAEAAITGTYCLNPSVRS